MNEHCSSCKWWKRDFVGKYPQQTGRCDGVRIHAFTHHYAVVSVSWGRRGSARKFETDENFGCVNHEEQTK